MYVLTQWVSNKKQELFTLCEHLRSLLVFKGSVLLNF